MAYKSEPFNLDRPTHLLANDLLDRIERRNDCKFGAQAHADVEQLIKQLREPDMIFDDFGSAWSAFCPVCHERSMQVVRPGKAQCSNCD